MPAARTPTLIDHIVELRWRLTKVVALFGVGAVLGYLVRGNIIQALEKPLGQELYFTSPTGSFEFIMQVCGLAGLVIALPVLIYQILRFIEPALSRPLKLRLILTVVASSYFLAAMGMLFAYYVGLPSALKFFSSVGTEHLQAMITIDKYFRFVMSYMVTFALAFQLPLLLLLIDHFTPLGPKKLRKWRKFVIVGAFTIALLTPVAPEPVTQMILAAPIIALYEFSVILIWFRDRRRRRLMVDKPVAAPPKRQLTAAVATLPKPEHSKPSPAPRRAPRPVAVGAALDLRGWQISPVNQMSNHTIDLRPPELRI